MKHDLAHLLVLHRASLTRAPRPRRRTRSGCVVAGRGWIAVALVIFAGYRPWNAVLAAFLFGLITSLGFVGQARNWPIAAPILSMLPYLSTIALMIVPALAHQKVRRLMAAPAALGEPYFRDVR